VITIAGGGRIEARAHAAGDVEALQTTIDAQIHHQQFGTQPPLQRDVDLSFIGAGVHERAQIAPRSRPDRARIAQGASDGFAGERIIVQQQHLCARDAARGYVSVGDRADHNKLCT